MQKNNKQLMFAISNSLIKSEAVSFAKTMNGEEQTKCDDCITIMFHI
jgi:hypothetical protein